MSGLQYIRPLFRNNLKLILAGFAALVVCDLGQLLIPDLLGRSIDLLSLGGAAMSDLKGPVARILALALIVAGARYAWRTLIIGFSRRVERGLRDRLYAKVVALSPRWHLENASGDLMAMATNDVENVRLALSAGLISVIDTVVLGCVALGFMLAISPSLTLWALLPLPVITLMTHFLGRRIYRQVLEVQDVFGRLTETVREKLAGFRVIRAMGLGHLALEEVDTVGRAYLQANLRQATMAGTFFPFLHFMSNLALALALYFGGRETILGQVSTGSFVAFITYLSMLTWPLIALGLVVGFLQQGLASLTRLGRVFDAEPEEAEARPPAPPLAGPPDIDLADLSYTYPGRLIPALKDISLSLAHDRFTALIGPMGGGKSTLAALLPALYTAPPGSLLVGGRPVEDWPPAELRSRFGYVPQDGFLFSGTIFENLTFGRPGASEAEARAAADIAGLTEDLAGFPDGLETVVGERGVTLSGGQRQRLSLARALVTDPAYLILDDTLSAVDAAVEAKIMARLLPRRPGRGGLIISHRLASLREVDWIVVLEDGRVTDQGTPAELLARESYFKRVLELGQFEEE